MLIISVRDEVAGTWSAPVTSANRKSAERDFRTACSDDRSLIGQHPNDFTLYAFGEFTTFEDVSKFPVLSRFQVPELICRGVKNGE